jgi:hypothetical protein
MKVYGGVDVYIHIFLTSALVGGEWSASRSGDTATVTHLTGVSVGRNVGLEDVPLPGLEPLSFNT